MKQPDIRRTGIRRLLFGILVAWAVGAAGVKGFPAPAGEIPRPLPEHPGNVFLAGERVSVQLPTGFPDRWALVDHDGKTIRQGRRRGSAAHLGRLPVGYYELRAHPSDDSRPVSVAVLEALKEPTPASSPIGLDAILAWRASEEQTAQLSSLAALTGVKWIRDRFSWPELEPTEGTFLPDTSADQSARVQAEAGFKILQMNHYSPDWTGAERHRFPEDLRSVYRFYREVSRRWRGRVQGIEPWNESDIEWFGHHTGAELAAFQKAAFFGLKSGHPDLLVGFSPLASSHPALLAELRENRAIAYCDTFNFHHYVPPDDLEGLYAVFRSIAAGRPLWVTECNQPIHSDPNSPDQDVSLPDARVQAERLPRLYATALHEGAAKVFYFTLTDYAEGPNQFGLLRKDLTPRPAFVALAAVGRLLAHANPLGRLKQEDPAVRAFAFRSRVKGRESAVIVAWTTNETRRLEIPATSQTVVYDHLGRRKAVQGEILLGEAPQFIVLPKEGARSLDLRPPPAPAPRKEAATCPIVLQPILRATNVLHRSMVYRLAGSSPERIPVHVYNFGPEPASGRFSVRSVDGWRCTFPELAAISAGGRETLMLIVESVEPPSPDPATLMIEGDFGKAGITHLSFRVSMDNWESLTLTPVPVEGAQEPAGWHSFPSSKVMVDVSWLSDGPSVEMRSAATGRWGVVTLKLPRENQLNSAGIQMNLGLLEGAGKFRVLLEENNKSVYGCELQPQPGSGVRSLKLAKFDEANWMPWSHVDPNGDLDLDTITAVHIACEMETTTVKFDVNTMRWLKVDR